MPMISNERRQKIAHILGITFWVFLLVVFVLAVTLGSVSYGL